MSKKPVLFVDSNFMNDFYGRFGRSKAGGDRVLMQLAEKYEMHVSSIIINMQIIVFLFIVLFPFVANAENDNEKAQENVPAKKELTLEQQYMQSLPQWTQEDIDKMGRSGIRSAEHALKNGDCQKGWHGFFSLSMRDGFKGAFDRKYTYLARQKLYNLILPPTTSDMILYPAGLLDDDLSRIHYALILAIHAKPAQIENDQYPPLELIKKYIPPSAAKDDYLSCVENDPAKDCAPILVDKNIAPNYRDFANEKFSLEEAGSYSRCSTDNKIINVTN